MTIRIEQVEWAAMCTSLSNIRRAVFIDEQAVPEALEWDGVDADCYHLLAFAGAQAIGTVRMTANGKIGRMAVLSAWRRQGVGQPLLTAILQLARQTNSSEVTLDPQAYGIPFYQRSWFEVSSGVFLDAGIEHQTMTLSFV
mgnify:CR=1 FL=1